MNSIRLTPQAKADLDEIWEYTKKQWNNVVFVGLQDLLIGLVIFGRLCGVYARLACPPFGVKC